MPRVLVIEDDLVVARSIKTQLEKNGHSVALAEDGEAGLTLALSEYFDVIALDRMLPKLDGLSIIGRLRERSIPIPVLVVSALSDVDERIAGLRAGGDDYLVKPFSHQELAARIEALVRRSPAAARREATLRAGTIEIDLLDRKASLEGKLLRLPDMEFRLLEFLVRNAGRVVGRRVIFEQVWGHYFDPGPNLINVHIGRLRKKMETPSRSAVIATVKGEGYRLELS
ncbi:response regulator transcription factor [Sphingomonas sp. AP4-R1]|uniref:response regulator transcription factor n=1 Tax=Sphingomonas sp. AP4-R1 TaxID=2735134 RepID=UPI0014934782|nr:response regulator transcription factor [Sphingomonas sp. AP4-R1]QJU57349.1 response regulator transcription factor [Sphingomonas sp. AP4-R1]